MLVGGSVGVSVGVSVPLPPVVVLPSPGLWVGVSVMPALLLLWSALYSLWILDESAGQSASIAL